MIIGLLKSLLYMFLFFFFIQFFGYIARFIYFFLNKKLHKNNIDSNADIKNKNALKMFQCEKCKIYIVKSEAYILNGKVFCKKEHSS